MELLLFETREETKTDGPFSYKEVWKFSSATVDFGNGEPMPTDNLSSDELALVIQPEEIPYTENGSQGMAYGYCFGSVVNSETGLVGGRIDIDGSKLFEYIESNTTYSLMFAEDFTNLGYGVLSHEFGHFFGLIHPWEAFDSNDERNAFYRGYLDKEVTAETIEQEIFIKFVNDYINNYDCTNFMNSYEFKHFVRESGRDDSLYKFIGGENEPSFYKEQLELMMKTVSTWFPK